MNKQIMLFLVCIILISGCDKYNQCQVNFKDGEPDLIYNGKVAYNRNTNQTCCVIGGYEGDINNIVNKSLFCNKPNYYRLVTFKEA